MRKGMLIVAVLLSVTALRAQADGAVATGCCQFKSRPSYAFWGLPPVLFCENTIESECDEGVREEIGADFDWMAGKVCASLGECVNPPAGGKIDTTNKLAPGEDECGTNQAKQIVFAQSGGVLNNCLQICNSTPTGLTNFTLIINGIAEFSNTGGVLPSGNCTSVRPQFTVPPVSEGTVFTRTAQWIADGVPDPLREGNAAGDPEPEPVLRFTETQQSFVIVQGATGAPTAGAVGLIALGVAMLALGIRRLARSKA